MGKRVPSEYKLFCIVSKGYHNTWSHYTPLFGIGSVIIESLVPVVLNEVQQKDLVKNVGYWVLVGLSVIFTFAYIIQEIIKFFNFNKDPFDQALKAICQFFNSSIMTGAEARATMFVYKKDYKKNKAHKYYRFCTTQSSNKIYCREYGELKCFEVFDGNEPIIVNLTDEERQKSNRTEIKSIFAFPVQNGHKETVAVISIDTLNPIEKCDSIVSLGENPNKAEIQIKINNIKEDLQTICDIMVKHILLKDKKVK